MKVLCYTFNAHHQSLCEKFYFDNQQQLREDKIEKSFFKFTKRSDCYNPLFFNKVAYQIADKTPNVVAFTTASDLSSGTYFHSDFLEPRMNKLGYVLLRRGKQSNHQNTIRLSVYGLKRDRFDFITNIDKKCGQNLAVIIYLRITLSRQEITLAFIAMDYHYDHADSCYRSMLDAYLSPALTGAFFMGMMNNTSIKNTTRRCNDFNSMTINVESVYFDPYDLIRCMGDEVIEDGILSQFIVT